MPTPSLSRPTETRGSRRAGLRRSTATPLTHLILLPFAQVKAWLVRMECHWCPRLLHLDEWDLLQCGEEVIREDAR